MANVSDSQQKGPNSISTTAMSAPLACNGKKLSKEQEWPTTTKKLISATFDIAFLSDALPYRSYGNYLCYHNCCLQNHFYQYLICEHARPTAKNGRLS
jgi:hypothetical protein